MSEEIIGSVEEFITKIKKDCKDWKSLPWFRGEPASETQLLPKLYRKKKDGTVHDENQLVQSFRKQAPWLATSYPLDREKPSEWLFLMQHVGLPTRLLDWTEGSLIALYFALQEKSPVVWMLHPIELNRLSDPNVKDNVFPLTWFQPHLGSRFVNIGNINFRAAWEQDRVGIKLPVAIHPTNIHPRMNAQRSCLTIHGKKKESLKKLLDDVNFKHLKSYIIDDREAKKMQMLQDLKINGISHATLFPDLDGLAKDLARTF